MEIIKETKIIQTFLASPEIRQVFPDHYQKQLRLVAYETEEAICQQVAAAAAPNGMNLAGQTSLEELAAVLSLSAGVLCNDSGGMHLAAALGTPLVGLFGITNADQTGPLGRNIRILQHAERRRRDVPRKSTEATKALRAITVDEAVQAVLGLLPRH